MTMQLCMSHVRHMLQVPPKLKRPLPSTPPKWGARFIFACSPDTGVSSAWKHSWPAATMKLQLTAIFELVFCCTLGAGQEQEPFNIPRVAVTPSSFDSPRVLRAHTGGASYVR